MSAKPHHTLKCGYALNGKLQWWADSYPWGRSGHYTTTHRCDSAREVLKYLWRCR